MIRHRAAAAARTRVMESFRLDGAETNPYLTQLVRTLPPDIEVSGFSWRRAVLGGQDAIHLHWPETLLRGTSTSKAIARRMLFAGMLVSARLRGTALIRTVHNVESHEPLSAVDAWLVRRCDAMTAAWIRLNDDTPVPQHGLATTILHGHYRDWFAGRPRSEPVPGRLLFFGLIRPYKGVVALERAFHGLAGAQRTLRIVGRPNSPELAAEVASLASDDGRISTRFAYVDDDELVREISAAQLVVLPYEELHNSGVLLLALSLDVPVLVPDSPTSRALGGEVGPRWVLRYRGAISTQTLETALAALDSAPPANGPDLSAREWPQIGREHAAVYRAAVAAVRARPVTRSLSPAPGAVSS